MYKVLLVDDEKQILDGLAKTIKWSDFGFKVCATARNAEEALSLIAVHKPDLVLTDIRMPGMDGLMLIEHVRKNISRDIEFIILSGYSEFQYAQAAIRFDVKNYILKPIDEVLLYGTLLDIKAILEEKEIRKSLKVKSYINSIISGAPFGQSELVLAEEEVYGIRFLSLERHMDYEALTAGLDSRQNIDLFSALSEKISPANLRFVLRQDKGKCFMVVGHSLLKSFEYDVKCLAACLTFHLSVTKGIPVDIHIGKKVKGFQNLHESIQSIALCRNRQFYLNSPSVILYEELCDIAFCKIYEDNGAVVRIISAFRNRDMDKLVKELDQLVQQLCDEAVVPEIALLHLDSIMASIVQILSERTEAISEAAEKYSEYKKVQGGMNIYDLKRLVTEFCMFASALDKKHKGSTDILEKVVKYVDEKYAQPLKIIDIAENFFVNPAYLGQLFIKKKNMSLNHYINSVRIEKSKELLANSNLKIYEIAVRTGFDDPNYFSAKFVEFTGQSPSEYRSSQSQ